MTGIRKASKIDWHPQNQEKLKTLWDQGLKASQITKEFPGSTRNGILGKAHRMGLSRKKDPVTVAAPKPKPKPRPKRQNPMVFKPAPKALPPELTPPTAVITFMELGPGTCRNVEGYSKQGKHTLPYYCANPKTDSMSFCPYHHGLYYQRVNR